MLMDLHYSTVSWPTNSLDHVTTYADYNVHGQAETIIAANGLTTTRTFNGRGQLLTSTTGAQTYTTAYGYSTSTGDLETIDYPSGTTVEYSYGADSGINAVTVDGTTIIDGVTRMPLGPITVATLAPTESGISFDRTYDARYNIMDIIVGADITAIHYSRDAEGHVTGIYGLPASTPASHEQSYTYETDSNRLTDPTGMAYITVMMPWAISSQTAPLPTSMTGSIVLPRCEAEL